VLLIQDISLTNIVIFIQKCRLVVDLNVIHCFHYVFLWEYFQMFRRSCLGSLLTHGLNCPIANETCCKWKGKKALWLLTQLYTTVSLKEKNALCFTIIAFILSLIYTVRWCISCLNTNSLTDLNMEGTNVYVRSR